MSGFTPEYPPRLTFDDDIAALSRSMIGEACGRLGMTAGLTSQLQDFGMMHFFDGQYYRSRQSAEILGSDEVYLHSVSGFLDESGAGHRVWLELRYDGSPFVPDSDLEKGGTNEYFIFSGQEILPTAVSEAFLQREGVHPIAENSLDMLEAGHRWGHDVLHLLSDDECTSLLTAIGQAGGDIDLEDLQDTF